MASGRTYPTISLRPLITCTAALVLWVLQSPASASFNVPFGPAITLLLDEAVNNFEHLRINGGHFGRMSYTAASTEYDLGFELANTECFVIVPDNPIMSAEVTCKFQTASQEQNEGLFRAMNDALVSEAQMTGAKISKEYESRDGGLITYRKGSSFLKVFWSQGSKAREDIFYLTISRETG